MFGPIGGPELILILVLALLLFGPRKLPQIGRTIGKALAEFRSVTTEFKTTLDREVALDELKQTREDLRSATAEVRGTVRNVARGALGEDDEPAPARSGEKGSEPAREGGGETGRPVASDGGRSETS